MNDRKTVNLVIGFVGAIAILATAGVMVLIGMERTIAEVGPLATIATGAVTGLVGLLASTKSVDVEGLEQLAADTAANGVPEPAKMDVHATIVADTGSDGDPDMTPPSSVVPPGVEGP